MKRNKSLILAALLAVCAGSGISGTKGEAEGYATLIDSVSIGFRQSKWNLDRAVGDNGAALDSIDSRLTKVYGDSIFRLRRVSVYGGASPEGSVSFNRFLSEQRAHTLFSWFEKYGQLSAPDMEFTFLGRDWEGVLRIAENDQSVPYRDETLQLLRDIVRQKREAKGEEPAGSLERLKRLRGGSPYRYLYRNIFPDVRASRLVVEYDRLPAPAKNVTAAPAVILRDTVIVERLVELRDTIYVDTCHKTIRQQRKNK